jgi:hypothetical protein
MIPNEPDIAIRAIGTGLAGASIVFAGYMFAFGGGHVRVTGMDYLAIFAQPRGAAIAVSVPAAPLPAVAPTAAPRG